MFKAPSINHANAITTSSDFNIVNDAESLLKHYAYVNNIMYRPINSKFNVTKILHMH